MALTYKATFRPEQRKNKNGVLITENVPLMLDLSFQGRAWYNSGFRLSDFTDFDVKKQKMNAGKKATKNKLPVSATVINNELAGVKGYINDAFNTAKTTGAKITAQYLIDEMQKLSGNKKQEEEPKELPFLETFKKRVNEWHKKNMIGTGRKVHYDIVIGMLDRYFTINKINVTASEFTPGMIKNFQSFLFDEYTLINKYPVIYSQMDTRAIPMRRTQNTVSSKLKLIKTYFNELEEKDLIQSNPFRKIGKRERNAMLRQSYDEPVCLTLDELLTIVNDKDTPESLQRVRDCFLLQTFIGSRIEDFNNLTWNNINTNEGFYVVHYAPSKTSHNENIKPIDCPLVKFGADIIQKYKDSLPGFLVPNFKGNISGKTGYNFLIKKLLEHYEINRGVVIRQDNELKTVPLHQVGSSKLARKTHVDITSKVALNKYVSGLHSEGSKSVDRYTSLRIDEKFKLYCQAFRQPKYTL